MIDLVNGERVGVRVCEDGTTQICFFGNATVITMPTEELEQMFKEFVEARVSYQVLQGKLEVIK